MPSTERQQAVLDILQDFKGLDGLKRLFWQELNYERVDKSLSPRQWPEVARQALADDPVLFAGGGEANAFHVIYCRLAAADLRRGPQRPIVTQLLRDHPYALFVFANNRQSEWHFVNVKYDEQAEKRCLFRRVTVRAGEGLRTAAERLAMLDLQAIGPDLFDLSPLLIQQHHDDAFDVEKVTKDFYREIANWYFCALKHVAFPKDAPKEKDGRDHISVIRLITRLIFCWFIREKGLIPGVLFDEAKLAGMLEGFAPCKMRNKDSTFYRAILQNLFFATLNTEMNQRGWRRADQNFMAHSLYRNRECFKDPKAGLEWFKDIPFLNGGLFECLDRDRGEGANPRYLRVDGFSDRDDSRPTVPDFLFFGSAQEVDLSDDYGDKKFRSVRVRGLIDTLNRYKFTIEENTPLDQEVALDPELCGKVFENLLAAYNPETGTTARKATGSFYTPREIVDYMVDESLVAYLKGQLATDDTACTDKKLRGLLSYDAEMPEFSEAETETLIEAIDGLKALDPAVGSGAFPMGMLHKLVHVLGRLDPGNERWKAKQIAKLDDAVMREDAERIFRENYDDYGRKLYLIENCIYGVDIQPIAVQIAKMRFFISLIVDQKVNPKAPNLGVRALPNLETKFVAANTLIGIEKPEQMVLRNPDIDKKEAELRRVRERHFTARTLKAKAKCREDDKRLRNEIADLLKNDGWGDTTAKQLAAWDPYDQNAHADFFDPEWVFGVWDGFDVVIGNPPYVSKQALLQRLPRFVAYAKERFDVGKGRDFDLFAFFIECGVSLAPPGGTVCFILPTGWYTGPGFSLLRQFVATRTDPRLFVNLPYDMFEHAWIDTTVFLAKKRSTVARWPRSETCQLTLKTFGKRHRVRSQEDFFEGTTTVDASTWFEKGKDEFLTRASSAVLDLLSKISSSSKLLRDLADVQRGVTPFKLTERKNHPNSRKAFAGTVRRYQLDPGPHRFIRYDSSLAEFKPARYFQGKRILLREMISRQMRLQACIANEDFVTNKSMQSILPMDKTIPAETFLAILNSQLMSWIFLQHSNVAHRDDFPKIVLKETRNLPFPAAVHHQETQILVNLVDRILAAKKADPAADTSALEREIDERVYQLYGLTSEEVAIVEGATHVKGGGK